MNTIKTKLKSVKFWVKAISGLAGGLVASGQVPEVLLPLFSEGVYQALGGVLAAIMGVWLSSDHQKDKKRKTKADLMGLLLVCLLPLVMLGCTSASYTSPDGTKITLNKVFTWQGFEGFEAKNLATDPDISIQKQQTEGIDLDQLLNILGSLR